MTDQYKLSQAGYDKLQSEYEELKGEKRQKAVNRLAKARAMGDLKENSEYSAAREEVNFIDGRINEIEEIIKRVEIVDEKNDLSLVQLGNNVVVESNGEKETFSVVGELEADITQGKISDSSPIGKALLGKKVGEKVSVDVPAGTVMYKIVEIK